MAYADPSNSARVTPGITNYARTSAALGDIRVRLTTGERILKIGDDVASISAAAGLQAQNATLRSTLTNGAKTSSFLQVAARGLAAIEAVLTRLGDLADTAVQSGRTTRQLKTLDSQFQSGLSEIDAIVSATTYGGATLLDGSFAGSAAASIPLGNLSGDAMTLEIPDVSSAALFPTATSLGTTAAATSAVGANADAQVSLADALGKVRAYQLRLQTAAAAAGSTIHGTTLSLESLLGTDRAAESQRAQLLTLQQDTTAALLAQTMNLNSGLLKLLSL